MMYLVDQSNAIGRNSELRVDEGGLLVPPMKRRPLEAPAARSAQLAANPNLSLFQR